MRPAAGAKNKGRAQRRDNRGRDMAKKTSTNNNHTHSSLGCSAASEMWRTPPALKGANMRPVMPACSARPEG